MTFADKERAIKLSLLDPMLYGAARAFDYLGFRGQDMIDRMGNGIIEYGVDSGYFEKSDDPHQFVGNVVKFFVENGYIDNVTVNQSGDTLQIGMSNWRFLPLMRKLRDRNSYLLTCPVCVANNAITKSAGGIGERVSENVTADGVFSMKVKIVPGTRHVQQSVISPHPADFRNTKLNHQPNDSVGLPAFECVAYGLAYGFDYLGAQGQLLLDNVGRGMLEFLREETSIELPALVENSLKALSTFMTDGGLARSIQVQVSKSSVNVDFEDYRYLPVLRKLLDGGRRLVACPFTLAARALIRREGKVAGEMKWQTSTSDANLSIPTMDDDNLKFDEEKTSSLMDQV